MTPENDSREDHALELFKKHDNQTDVKTFRVTDGCSLKDIYEAVRWGIRSIGADIESSEESEVSSEVKAIGKVLGEKKTHKIAALVQKFGDIVGVKVRHDMKVKKQGDLGNRAIRYFWREVSAQLGVEPIEMQGRGGPTVRSSSAGESGMETEVRRKRDIIADIVDSIVEVPEAKAVVSGCEVLEDPGDFLSAIFEAARSDDQWPSYPLSLYKINLRRQSFPALFLLADEVDFGTTTTKPLQFSFVALLPHPVKFGLNISDKFYFSLIEKVADEFKIVNYLNSELPLLRRYLSEAYKQDSLHHYRAEEVVEDRGKTTKVKHDIVRQFVVQIRNIEFQGDSDAYVVARFWFDQKFRNLPEIPAILKMLSQLSSDLSPFYEVPAEQAGNTPIEAGTGASGQTPAMPAPTPGLQPAGIAKTPEKCPHCGWLLSPGKTTCPMCKKSVLEEEEEKEYSNKILRELKFVDETVLSNYKENLDGILDALRKADKKFDSKFPMISEAESLITENIGDALPFIRAVGQWDVQPIVKYYISVIGGRHFSWMVLLADFLDTGTSEPPAAFTFVVPAPKPMYFNFAADSSGVFVDDLEPRLTPETMDFLRRRHAEVEKVIGQFYRNPKSTSLQGDPHIKFTYPIRVVNYETGQDVASVVIANHFGLLDKKGFPQFRNLVEVLDDFLEATLERVPDPSTLAKCESCGRVLVLPGPLCRTCQEGSKIVEEAGSPPESDDLNDLFGGPPAIEDAISPGQSSSAVPAQTEPQVNPGFTDDLGDFLGGDQGDDLGDFLGEAAGDADLDDFLGSPDGDVPVDQGAGVGASGSEEPVPLASPPTEDEPLPTTMEETDQKIQEIKYQIDAVKDLMNSLQAGFSAGQVPFADFQARNSEYIRVLQEMQDKVARLERHKFNL
ncbi:MAG: zinc ribbon domain-containing protein [Promethearchaeota archaeon]